MRTMLSLATLLIAAAPLSAQWQPSDIESTRLDKQGTTGQMQLKTLRMDDGAIVLTWLRWSGGYYSDPATGYYMHMQIFSPNGLPMLGDEGVLVCGKPTASWTSDYGLALAENGDVVIAYNDARDDATGDKQTTSVYVYRYDRQGNPVWDADGIKMQSASSGSDIQPEVCCNGDKVFVSWFHKGDSGDSSGMLLQCLDAQGQPQWQENMAIASDYTMMRPCLDTDIYLLYANESFGLEALRLTPDGDNAWGDPIVVEADALSSGFYMSMPEVDIDAYGGLSLTYRKLETFTGYQVLNHLTPDGDALAEAVLCRGNKAGDSNQGIVATRDDYALVAWEFKFGDNNMYINMMELEGNPVWPEEKFYGQSIDQNDMWGFKPLKIIPQTDGWVLLYGHGTSWNGANFMVVKLSDEGDVVWSKMIAGEDMKSSGFSIVNDEKNAYIFYTRDNEIGDDWEEIPGTGGMFVMCVDIVGDYSGITRVASGESASLEIYNLEGKRTDRLTPGVNIMRSVDASGNVTTRKIVR